MKKTGLKQMKRSNREMLIRTVLEKSELSRIGLAHETQLSPSTVSALVGELLEEGILAESGQRAITAGRSRTALDINKETPNTTLTNRFQLPFIACIPPFVRTPSPWLGSSLSPFVC